VTRQINLDQQRTEAGKEPVEVIVGGRSFTFAPRLPVEVAMKVGLLDDADNLPWEEQERLFMIVTAAMVGEEDAPAFIAAIDMAELMWLMEEVYGADMGELLASAASSGTTGNGSRRT
jgi:hypothetical protein